MSRGECDPVLGFECGATHTVGLAVAGSGECLVRVEDGPANLRLLSDRRLAARFRSIARRLPWPAAVGIGMAGIREASDRRRAVEVANRIWPGVPCWVGSDFETAFAASDDLGCRATRTRVIVIGGTGSCCYGRNRTGRTVTVGGWGHILGDKGSAYDVALTALQTAIHQWDYAGVWPDLGARLLGCLQLNEPNELVTWLHAADKAAVAVLAVEVFAAAERGDRLARRLVTQAAARLASEALACARRLTSRELPVDFVFVGGLLRNQTGFARCVARELHEQWPAATTRFLPREGAWGAVAQAQCLLSSRAAGKRSKSSRHPRLGRHGRAATGCQRAGSAAGRAWDAPGRGPAANSGEALWESAADAQPAPIPEATGLPPTERRNPRSRDLDRLPVASAIRLMLSEEARIARALRGEVGAIERAIASVVRAFRRGGRLFYVGAGTSGRLGVLDAIECPPTFRTPPGQVQAVIAGGHAALWSSVEGGEDDARAGASALGFRGVARRDVVVGIAASGRTPFVWGALARARAVGATTVLLCCNPCLRFGPGTRPTVVIALDVGPEVLTGSTRLKAGTATKIVLNMLTTLAMTRMGKVKSNLMIDVHPTNAKLRDRAVRIVTELGGVEPEAARRALERAEWSVEGALRHARSSDSPKPPP